MTHDDLPASIDTPFGTFDLEPDSIVRFPDGLPGYESCRRFVLVTSPGLMPLQCLQAVENRDASFLVADPGLVCPDYRHEASASDLERLDAGRPDDLLWLSILTVDTDGMLSANLRAPVVINPERMLGSQLIPQQSEYPLRHALPLAG